MVCVLAMRASRFAHEFGVAPGFPVSGLDAVQGDICMKEGLERS